MQATIRNRLTLLAVVVVTLAGGIGWRLLEVQLRRSDDFQARAGNQHFREKQVDAPRGAIVDRNGRELALTVETDSLYVYPGRLDDAPSTAREVAPVIGHRKRALARKLERDVPGRIRVARALGPDTVRSLRHLGLFEGARPAFELEREFSRSYPNGRVAAHVVGFAGAEMRGLAGIERTRETDLRGGAGHLRTLVNGRGEEFVEHFIPPTDPNSDVMLSIDVVLQHIVERELRATVDRTAAKGAFAVMLHPKTGEILALANHPAPELDTYGRCCAECRRNRALRDGFEPGSTFKMFSAAALLERGLVQPNTLFYCEKGRTTVHGTPFTDHDPFETLSFRGVIEHSSNVGVIKAASRIDGDDLVSTLRGFGFGRSTGVELPEVEGALPDGSRLSAVRRASLSIGYGATATAVQLASAVGTIANGGVRVPPRLVVGSRAPDGTWTPDPLPESERVISESTARTLTSILEGVVKRGTGQLAAIDGYRVAGKTGTARKHVEGVGYSRSDYYASFAGYAPANDPEIALVVVVDSPTRGLKYGGTVAAPAFSTIVSQALVHLRVPPEGGAVLVRDPGLDLAKRGAPSRGHS